MKQRHAKIGVIKTLIIGLVFSLGLLVNPTVRAVDTDYGCGTYGAGDYGDECSEKQEQPPDDDDEDTDTPTDNKPDPVTPGTSGTPPSTDDPDEPEPEEPAESDRIILNDYSRYSSGTGQSFSLALNQVLYFTLDGEEHSVTVKEITADYVVVTIASDPVDVTVNRGETIQHDVDGNGTNDLEIAYIGQSEGKAILTFAEVKATEDTVIPDSPAASASLLDWWWLWLLLGLGGVGLVTWAIVSRRRRA